MIRADCRGHEAEYVILQFAGPGRPIVDIGVLLLDPISDRLYFRFRNDWGSIADREDVEVLSGLAEHFSERARESGGAELLRWLEDRLSTSLLMTERRRMWVTDFNSCLSDLFNAIGRVGAA